MSPGHFEPAGWVLAETSAELAASARRGFGVSLLLAALAAAALTRSLRAALCAAATIGSSSIFFLAAQASSHELP